MAAYPDPPPVIPVPDTGVTLRSLLFEFYLESQEKSCENIFGIPSLQRSGLHRAAPLKTSGDKARGHKVKLVTAENVGSSSVCFEKC